ncbi:unnamed protein product [Clonostachys rosea f. rosea IK726]|uniref:Uncharacterized protein n=1 Tax=Clonostachys rosea f. rosea IK726 TaxID=1349383 RepID=A0ACA9TWZ9_BIOOC|nr:unnamed protein product [Clonostachys rosea f. rosea IK726]
MTLFLATKNHQTLLIVVKAHPSTEITFFAITTPIETGGISAWPSDVNWDAPTSLVCIAVDENGSGRTPKRVVIAVSRKSPHWAKAWTSSEELIAVALGLMQEKHLILPETQTDLSAIRFLAMEIWGIRTYIVFDVFHGTYDPDKAHLAGENEVPAIPVFLGQKESASITGRPMTNKVNSDIRALHNATGPGSRPPFVVDHADGKVPYYPHPRAS